MDRKQLGYGLVAASAIGAIVLAATGGKPKAKRQPLVREGQRVVLIGDSLGVGLARPLAKLAAASGVTLDPQACGGTMVFQWVREDTAYPGHDTTVAKKCTFGLRYIRQAQPDVVLISLGTNDAYSQESVIAKEHEQVAQLVTAIREMGAQPVWIDPPKLAKAPNVPAMLQLIYSGPASEIPHFESDEMDVSMSGDAIHPTGNGYDSWAAGIWAWLTGKPLAKA